MDDRRCGRPDSEETVIPGSAEPATLRSHAPLCPRRARSPLCVDPLDHCTPCTADEGSQASPAAPPPPVPAPVSGRGLHGSQEAGDPRRRSRSGATISLACRARHPIQFTACPDGPGSLLARHCVRGFRSQMIESAFAHVEQRAIDAVVADLGFTTIGSYLAVLIESWRPAERPTPTGSIRPGPAVLAPRAGRRRATGPTSGMVPLRARRGARKAGAAAPEPTPRRAGAPGPTGRRNPRGRGLRRRRAANPALGGLRARAMPLGLPTPFQEHRIPNGDPSSTSALAPS
jgi:hypothetical protein